MAKRDYFPRRDKDFRTWFTNFIAKLRFYAVILGIDVVSIDELEAVGIEHADDIDDNEAAQTTAEKARTKKDASGARVKPIIRKRIKTLKLNDAYTDAQGQDMGIIGDEHVFDPDNYKPKLKLTLFPSYIRLDFVKGHRIIEAVVIYSRLKGETVWQKLGVDFHSPYIDERPLAQAGVAETREFMAIGLSKDEEIGQMSDIVTVVFGG